MTKDKILIIDEGSFSRVCSAILAAEGYATSQLVSTPETAKPHDVGLVIASYPYGTFFFDHIKEHGLPVIVLTDHICTELIDHLEQFPNSYCMIKPIDFLHFKKVVGQYMSGDWSHQGGYSIV